MSATNISVLVVEDHPIYRDGLLAALADAAGVRVVGGCSTVAEAISRIDADNPAVALVDLALPDGSGLDVARRCSGDPDGPAVVILTMTRQPDVVLEAVRAGARGYLVKGAGGPEIAAAVRAVARGEVVFGADVADNVLAALVVLDPATAAFPMLSSREREVLSLLADGLTNQAIATRLSLADKTVRNLVSNVISKLGVTSRHEAAQLARQAAQNGANRRRI